MSTDPTPDEQDLETALGHFGKDDLVRLIKRMVQQHPDLAGLIVSNQQATIKKPRAPFQAYVEMRIEWRGRENYHTACQYLLSIRRLYQKVGKSNEWTTYIADLRERNARLPALKDEMTKAKL